MARGIDGRAAGSPATACGATTRAGAQAISAGAARGSSTDLPRRHLEPHRLPRPAIERELEVEPVGGVDLARGSDVERFPAIAGDDRDGQLERWWVAMGTRARERLDAEVEAPAGGHGTSQVQVPGEVMTAVRQ